MNYKVQKIDIGALALNQGQIEGLPANPRQWTREDIDKIAASLRETPELFEMRPCIVTPHGEQFVILAGSLRFCGARQNGDKDVPCIVFEGSTDKMKEIVIKDNGSFGAWDFDSLGNEWDDLPLGDWGVPAWNNDIPEETESVEDTAESGDSFVIKYEIIFDDEGQQGRWFDFIKDLKDRFPECDTIAERIDKFLEEVWQNN